MRRALTCKELIDFLWAYLEGEVSEEAREEFEDHLAACPSCVAYVATYEATRALTKDAYADDERLPSTIPEPLIAAVLAATSLANGL